MAVTRGTLLIKWELPHLIEQVRSVCEIAPEGCWLWRYGTFKDGTPPDGHPYPRIMIDGERHLVAHWVLVASGQPRPDGMEPCHSCDRPPCVFRDHLRWDTHKANMIEMGARGRSGSLRHPERFRWRDDHPFRLHPELSPLRRPRPDEIPRGDDHWTRRTPGQMSWLGTAHHQARFDPGKVRWIRSAYADGESIKVIATALGVGWTTVQAVIQRRTWKHVT